MPYRWRRKKKVPFFLGVVIALTVVFAAWQVLSYFGQNSVGSPFSVFTHPDLSTSGYVLVQPAAGVINGQGVVSLTGGCYELVATTETVQAESISNGLNQLIGLRPNTHDLVKDIFDGLEINVVMVKIVEIRNNTFIGWLILESGNKILNLDSRPSDGIAVAVRTESPIYVKESLLQQYGSYVC